VRYANKVFPTYNLDACSLCVKPYPGHPKGCPNWNKKQGCPPQAPKIYETLDLSETVYVIYNVFNIGQHARRMLELHPQWSERQCYCCLYWQPKARKQLQTNIRFFLADHPKQKIITCPEAQGVNLTATMKKIGVDLEWPPRQVAYQIVLAGTAL